MSLVRRASKNDIDAIMNLLGQVLLVHHIGRPDIFKEKGAKYTVDRLEEMVLDDENPIFVYETDEGKVVAHCFCNIFDKPETSNTFAYKTLFIDDLCIDENYRGHNIGRDFYEHMKAYAKENGFYNITLHAWECNPKAVGFYEHMGMKIQQYTMEEIL